MDDALIRLRRHIWGDEPPDADDPYADRTASALEALGFEAENLAPRWFQPFKAGGVTGSDEYSSSFADMFCEVCHDCYRTHMACQSY